MAADDGPQDACEDDAAAVPRGDDAAPPQGPGRAAELAASTAAAALVTARHVNRSERLVALARRLRGRLPGDQAFGDPLSTAGATEAQVLGRALADLSEDRPGLLREAGFGALQLWQVLAEARGRGRGPEEVTILFTDLVGFSTWALRAGDDDALALLRAVGQAVEPEVRARRGRIVKRLGDGVMAVFPRPQDAVDAVLAAQDALVGVEVDGHRPQMRAGLHVGRPRPIGGDLLGVDVNVAARIADGAGAGELLVSDRALALLDLGGLTTKRKRFFRAKGVPAEVTVHSVFRA